MRRQRNRLNPRRKRCHRIPLRPNELLPRDGFREVGA
jgi:hypothetical protein